MACGREQGMLCLLTVPAANRGRGGSTFNRGSPGAISVQF